MVKYSIDHGMPAVCRLKFKKGGNWAYATNGHFMNAHGYTIYEDKIAVTDPNIKRVDSSAGGSYWVTLDELHKVTHDYFAQEMAY